MNINQVKVVFIILVITSCETASQAQSALPGPAVIWPSGPLEVIAAFDRPLDQSVAKTLVNKQIAYFETGIAKPKGSLRIAGARLVDDGAELWFSQRSPHPAQARYQFPIVEPASGGKTRPSPFARILTLSTGSKRVGRKTRILTMGPGGRPGCPRSTAIACGNCVRSQKCTNEEQDFLRSPAGWH